MLTTILTTALALAAASTASPLANAPKYPPTSRSTGFSLVAYVSDPALATKVFAPNPAPGKNWTVGGVHVGAGQSTAVLGSVSSTVFYQNGTASGSHKKTDGLIRDGPATYPYSIVLGTANDAGAIYIGLNVGEPTLGVAISSGPVAEVSYAPASRGTFLACNETEPTYGRPQYPIRFAPKAKSVPAGCVPISLLAQCATLAGLDANGLEYEHDTPATVNCYKDVASIDWSQYRL
ncbi:hypothetical protein B0T22DRAFT_189469 [Podospora appendiculata]|uniref:DUF7907 domain-containing protein n=1 Tax=Podospora appendiculata TaxID=314037 RepID=A0AAE0XD70_9PEZI|nr:hypothetical protein B0T22DRAFT_189469 [Podospora appendiculata]